MSVRNTCKIVSVCDALTGKILGCYDLDTFDTDTMDCIISCLYYRYVTVEEHGLLIKVGSSDL